MSQPKTVLLVAQRPSDYVEMRRCALALRSRGYQIHFCYHCIYGDVTAEIPILREIAEFVQNKTFVRADVVAELHSIREIKIEDFDDLIWRLNRKPLVAPKKRYSWWRHFVSVRLRGIKYRLADTRAWAVLREFLSQVATQFLVIRTYLARMSAYRSHLKRTQPNIIILPEDVVGLVTPLMIRGGQEQGIPSLIVPYTIADQQEAFRSLQSRPNYQMHHWVNYPVALLRRSWVMRQDGIALVRLPAAYIVGHTLTRTSPPDPWMMNSGYANAIAVENRAMFDFYRRAGIPETKMQIVGAAYDDQLAGFLNNKKAELEKLGGELGVTVDKPLFVIGGCPDQSGSCPAFEFRDMADFAAHLAGALAPLKDDYFMIVRPHPNYPELGTMLSRYGFISTEIDTARLVALSDVYVAFASATIRWAIACGIPTINYDVFQYDYDDFKKVSGVMNVMRYDDFRSTVERMRPNNPERAKLAERARTEAPRWGQLDGKSLDRIVALIESLCASKPVLRTAS